jgi:uncharacterized protein (DUF433 family)
MASSTASNLFTRNETAEISGVSVNAVNKALEQRIAKPRRSRGRTLLAVEEAAALALISQIPARLSVKLKRELRDWIVDRSPQPAEELELSPALRVAMTDYASEVAARAEEYARLRDKYVEVDSRKLSGTPVIRGTRMPVRTLAELVESGESREALKEDYPHIPEEAYEVAVIWARGNPRRGRPSRPTPQRSPDPSRRAAPAA